MVHRPREQQWFTRLAVSSILFQRIADLKLSFPKVTDAKKKELLEIQRILMAEDARAADAETGIFRSPARASCRGAAPELGRDGRCSCFVSWVFS